jgi:hypothetical protein
MNRYIVFYQTAEDDLSRTYQEIDAASESEAQSMMLKTLNDNQTIISVWEKVT